MRRPRTRSALGWSYSFSIPMRGNEMAMQGLLAAGGCDVFDPHEG